MKLNLLEIRLLTGFTFLAILAIIIYCVHPKDSNQKNNEQKIYLQNNTSHVPESYSLYIDNTSQNTSVATMKNPKLSKITKEEIFSLLNKGLENNSNVEAFIYTKEFFQNKNVANVFFEGKYKDLTDYLKLFKYKDNAYYFDVLKSTNTYIWGNFYEENIKESTYIVVNKSDGKIKSLNNSSIQVVVY